MATGIQSSEGGLIELFIVTIAVINPTTSNSYTAAFADVVAGDPIATSTILAIEVVVVIVVFSTINDEPFVCRCSIECLTIDRCVE